MRYIGSCTGLLLVLVACSQQPALAQVPGWTRVESPVNVTLHRIVFIDVSQGFILAGNTGQVMNTRNSGNTWRVIGRADSVGHGDLLFEDLYRGWMAGVKGRIYHTETGGLSWQTVPTPGKAYRYHDLLRTQNGTLLAAGTRRSFSRWKPFLEMYSDSLESWQPIREELPGFSLHALHEDNAGNLWAGGRDLLFEFPADDSGMRIAWQNSLGACGEIEELYFHGDSLGWAVGACGLMLRTTDAGESWQQAPPFTKNRLLAMGSTHPKVLYVAAERTDGGPTFFRSIDTGETWEPVPGVSEVSYYDFAVTQIRMILVGAEGTIFVRDRADDYELMGDTPPPGMVREIEGELRPGMLMQEIPSPTEDEATQPRRP